MCCVFVCKVTFGVISVLGGIIGENKGFHRMRADGQSRSSVTR